MTDFIEIEIDGKKIQAKPHQTVIQAADDAGIYIPRFCYHKELSIVANCRMCLVDVEKAPKPMPACAMPLTPGMKISTKSPKAVEAQRSVMEFLLINHPLDCPVCDQGGECELQDLALSYGRSKSHYCENKRSVADRDIGPLVATEMTRCIQCTRCVRFGDEIAGLRELGAVNRGEDLEITTYVQHALQSELSGNIIDICPVGALTAKPSRFKARPWELVQAPTISPHDCIGSNLNAHTRNGKVMRMVSRHHPDINEMWIADRDRFSYESLYHEERLTQPMVKLDGKWEKTDWMPALDFAVGCLRRVMVTNSGDHIGTLISPNATLEELFLLQKLVRGLGSSNIDHRLRQTDYRDQAEMPLAPGLGMPIADLETVDAVLLIGSNVQKEQPIAGLRLRKAYLKGATISAVNMMDYKFHFKLAGKKIVAPHAMVQALAGVAKALGGTEKILENIQVDEAHQQIADFLKKGKKALILVGTQALNHPQASILRRLARLIANLVGAHFGQLTEGANTAGAWLAGAIPHRKAGGKVNTQIGLNATAMLEKNRKGYILFNVEPDLDCADPILARSALQKADFVVAFSTFRSPVLEEVANVILPIAPFTEMSGTFVNAASNWQSFKPVAKLYENSQPGWKALCSLGNLFQLPGFRYESAESVREEIYGLVSNLENSTYAEIDWRNVAIPAPEVALSRIGEIPLYAVDGLVRRSRPLQEAQQAVEGTKVVRLNPSSGFKANDNVMVKQKQAAVILPVVLDERVPPGAAWIAGGIKDTAELAELFGEVVVQKV
jgi:NADH-quinone oxidoreductase subunit G